MLNSIQEFQEIRDALRSDSPSLYARILEKDYDYLLDAYMQIEQYWVNQFLEFGAVHLVLLSEAPLFGKRQTFFYNPNAGVTRFFNYNDYANTFPLSPPILTSRIKTDRKQSLLKELCKLGVLILDLFPFALNDCTNASYNELAVVERAELFRITAPYYFRRKMLSVLKKMTPHTLFVFRYGRVLTACSELICGELTNLKIDLLRIESAPLGGPWGIIRHDVLRAAYDKAKKIY